MERKVFVMGIDGLDARLTKQYLDEGIMPNLKKFLERGSARADVQMIGGHPTVTPPMWTTLGTGASPYVHGVNDFYKAGPVVGQVEYNFDSRNCKAEPLWNVTAEAGLKTLVWHWPGSSWPPTSDNENLYVVDGTQPEGVNCGNAEVDPEKLLIASSETPEVKYRVKAASDTEVPCYISGMDFDEEGKYNALDTVYHNSGKERVQMAELPDLSEVPFDIAYSPIKAAEGWSKEVGSAKEMTMLASGGLVRRPCLIVANKDGVYDTVEIYKNKKAEEPIAVLKNGEYFKDYVDEVITGDEGAKVMSNRNMRILEMHPDGNYVKMWISFAMDIANDVLWHPKTLHKEIIEHVGYPQPICLAGGHDEQLIADCMRATWDVSGDWNSDAIKYLARNHGFKMIFSHFHNVDLQGHMLVAFLKNGSKLPAETVQRLFKEVYIQTDRYIGQYLELLDEGWDIIIVSDHGQVCPEHHISPLMAASAIDGRKFVERGYTVLKKDENGNNLPEVDWAKTKAVLWLTGEVWINLKGRDFHDGIEGIVDPADQYELEEQIMTDLYKQVSDVTGHRVVSLALRNREAVLLGMGGPNVGDIIFYNAEGYTFDHCDELSTTYGACGTSVMSVFAAAGPGIKENYATERVIKHVDVVPTIATLLGVRMPNECEGAPVYQIFE